MEWFWNIPVVARVFTMMFVGAFFWALYNVSMKKELNKQDIWKNRDAAITSLVMFSCSIMLFIVAMFTGGPQITSGFWFAMLATGVFNVFIQYASTRSKALEDVSLVAPISSTVPAIVIFTSFIILGEVPTFLGWLGIWVLAIGTYTIQIQDFWKKLSERKEIAKYKKSQLKLWFAVLFAPFLALRRSRGVRWAFGAALLGTISLNYDGVTARTANIAFGTACIFGITALGNLVFFALPRGEFKSLDMRYAIKTTLWPALLFALFHLAINPTYRETIVPYVGTLKRLQIPMTIILAYLMIDERKNFRQRLIGGALMGVGAALIAIGMARK